MNLDAAVKTFVAESRDLVEQMEAALLAMEQGTHTPDMVNALFRAAHTIKGSAGVFGFDDMVAFTHVVESVLERLRAGEIEAGEELISTLLAATDVVHAQVNALAASGAEDAALRVSAAGVLAQLAAYQDGACPEKAPATVDTTGAHEATDVTGDGVQSSHWHISVRFGRDVLRNGMDPLSFIRYLARLGDIRELRVVDDALPEPELFDPESCYLGFEIALASDADKSTLEDAFAFVRDDCMLHILPPSSRLADYERLLREQSDGAQRLGEMLVQCGTLTSHELALALHTQADAVAAGATQAPLGEILVEQGSVEAPLVQTALQAQQQTRRSAAPDGGFVRVDAHKLDTLIDLVGEVVIANASTSLLARHTGLSDLVASTATLGRLVEEVRDTALGLRMVPIGATFNRFHRVVRDVSRELGKHIDLAVSGGDTELDKTMVDRIGDPLMHLVRNAMDHGIEAAELRAARGKPARGTLSLNAHHDSGHIVIEVADDGNGLERDRILAKALDQGLIQPGQTLADAEVWQLIFEPGFSTATAVTNLSGRGVGMDVVKSNVAAMRGSVSVSSQPGHGTTVRIHLPLTLAIIDGFLVKAGGVGCVIPLEAVKECVELDDAQREAFAREGYMNLRGTPLPLLRLREQFDLHDATPRRETVVVVRATGQQAGLVVDELLGELQTVIKPLGRLFQHLGGISGSTILGSGEVALILDVPGLIRRATGATTVSASRSIAMHSETSTAESRS